MPLDGEIRIACGAGCSARGRRVDCSAPSTGAVPCFRYLRPGTDLGGACIGAPFTARDLRLRRQTRLRGPIGAASLTVHMSYFAVHP